MLEIFLMLFSHLVSEPVLTKCFSILPSQV
jgi:hypothetical protein